MKCLLLEDDIELNGTIRDILKLDHYKIDCFYDGQKVLDILDTKCYDIYIFDINTPNIDGIELLKYIKCISPKSIVLMISADITTNTIETAYKYGCYDFLKKPFILSEIRYKLKIIKDNFFAIYYFDENTHYDYSKQTLYNNQKTIKLTKKELQLLNLLINNKKSIVSKDMIIENVYDNTYTSDTNIRALMKRLRAKINNSKKLITLPTVGFILE